LETSALGSLIAACPAWKRREKRERPLQQCVHDECGFFLPLDEVLKVTIVANN